MRLRSLDLCPYGPFEALRFDFGESASADLHLIYGANEAGKSTTRRALLRFLFGFPNRGVGDTQRFDQTRLRISAELQTATGVQRLTRRKGRGNTLQDAEGEGLADSTLSTLLQMDEARFRLAQCLDHGSLVAGGQELLAGEGDLAETLFSAQSGMRGLRELADGLEQEAKAYFVTNQSKRQVNVAIAEVKQLRKALREQTLLPRQHAETQRAFDEAAAALESLREQGRALHEEREVLLRVRRQRSHVERYRGLEAELAALGDAPELPEGCRERREQAQQSQSDARVAIEKVAPVREALRAQLEAHAEQAQDDALLGHRETIAELVERRAGHLDAAARLPELERRRDALLTAGIVAPAAPPAEVDVALDALRELEQAGAALRSKLATLREGEADAPLELARLEDNLEAAEAVADAGPMQALLDRLRSQQPAQALARLDTELSRLRGICEDRHRALGYLQAHALEALPALPFPSAESLQAHRRALDEVADALRGSEARCVELARQRDALVHKRDALSAAGEPISRARLLELRRERDLLWTQLRGLIEAPAQPGGDSSAAIARYEAKVAEVDALADRRAEEAERSAAWDQLLRDLERNADAVAEAEAAREAARESQQRAEEHWLALWAPLKVSPASPAEMGALRERFRALLAELTRMSTLRGERDVAAQAVCEAQSLLAAALTEVGATPATGPLAALEDQATAVLRRLEEARGERHAAETRRRELQARVARLTQQSAQAEAELERWTAEWADALAPFGLQPTQRWQDARQVADLCALQSEIADIETAQRSFTERSRRIAVEALADTEANKDAAAQVDALARALDGAKRRRARREEAAAALIEPDAGHDAAVIAEQQATERLAALLAEAGVADLPALIQAEAVATKRRARDELVAALAAEAVPLEALIAEVEAMPEAEAAEALQAIELRLEAHAAEVEPLRRRHIELEQQLGQAGHAAGAEAALAQQAAVAQLAEGVESYLRLRLAQGLLRQELSRFRERHEGPMLRRASEIFARLTGGAFARLLGHSDDGERETLVALRSGEDDFVGVEAMSEGSRDQLYLALRLAAWGAQAEAPEPLPVLLDDVLINFDDDRAVAALSELAALAQHTQVLLFTHHAHLLALARESLPAGTFRTHHFRASEDSGA